ncbi:MAG: (Na+)-NQR maturation NqrM [Candidatus Arsenophonus melophagi]|nr:(Na+)-NQR maturation NqrM [Candidatus Arsenophonus melophagi]
MNNKGIQRICCGLSSIDIEKVCSCSQLCELRKKHMVAETQQKKKPR